MRIYEADLTGGQLVRGSASKSLPRGMAEERMIQVMTREIPGSKYNVHRPSQLAISMAENMKESDVQPNDETSSNDTNVSEAI